MRITLGLAGILAIIGAPAAAASFSGELNPNDSGYVEFNLAGMVPNHQKYNMIFSYEGGVLASGHFDLLIIEEEEYRDPRTGEYLGGDLQYYPSYCSITSPCLGDLISLSPREDGFRAIINANDVYEVYSTQTYRGRRIHDKSVLELQFLGTGPVTYSLSVTPLPSIPEPASWAMMILGFGLVGGAMRVQTKREALA